MAGAIFGIGDCAIDVDFGGKHGDGWRAGVSGVVELVAAGCHSNSMGLFFLGTDVADKVGVGDDGPRTRLVCYRVLQRLRREGRWQEEERVAGGGFVFLKLDLDAGTSTLCAGTGGRLGDAGASTLCSGTGGSTLGDAGTSTLCSGIGGTTIGIRGGAGTLAGMGVGWRA